MDAITGLDRQLPWFDLPRVNGGRLRSSQWRGRANLAVLAFSDLADEQAWRFVARVDRWVPQFDEVGAQPLVIAGGLRLAEAATSALSSLRLPIAVDESGSVLARLEADRSSDRWPVVLLTDRYGEVRWRAAGWSAFGPSAVETWLDILRYVDYLCSA